MDEDYDVIILGTGLKECILSGLLSTNGKKVLHMDRNGYYGAESASLNLEDLYKKFNGSEAKVPEELGRARDYNVDLCPKFIMACGNLVKMLLHTKVTRYLEFKSINGSYVYKDGKIYKVPCTAAEALSSGLMGVFQKRRFRNLLTWVDGFELDKPQTHQGIDVKNTTMRKVFEHFKCDANTIAFAGHGLALYQNENYLDDPAETLCFIERAKLYAYSVSRYGKSPYIYPVWGLGGLPEGFSRLSAVYGGTYMLNRPVDEILYDGDGKVKGVRSNGEEARCKQLLADPSYFAETDNVEPAGKVARWLFILDHPLPNTDGGDSCQIIVPAKQLRNRHSDIYVASVSFVHQVAAKGHYIAMVSGKVETDNPRAELEPVLQLIGPARADFFSVSDYYVPTEKRKTNNGDGVFVTSSYDASTHFETATTEVLHLYEQMTGEKLDMTISAEPEDVQSLE